MQLCDSLSILSHCLFWGLEWKLTFSSPGITAEFSNFADILSAALFAASSFRIWSNSTGIPSPPVVLFIVMLPKAHLTSRSKMSGSKWVITPSWVSGSWRSFLYSSYVYSCQTLNLNFISFLPIMKYYPSFDFVQPFNSLMAQNMKDRSVKSGRRVVYIFSLRFI